MPPIKFRLNLTRFGRRCCLMNFNMATVAAILGFGTERLSKSKSLRHCDSSHQVLVQTDIRFGRRCCLKNLGHLGNWNGTLLAILSFHFTTLPDTKFQLNSTRFLRRCRKCEKLTTDNRPWHKLTKSKTPGELKIKQINKLLR